MPAARAQRLSRGSAPGAPGRTRSSHGGPAGAPSGAHTQIAFEVRDIEATVNELRARGVEFEDYDLTGLQTSEGIAEVQGNYPSKGGLGERAAWFTDSEGNLLAVGQRVS